MKKYILCNTLLEHEGLYINRNCSNYGYRGGLSDAQSTCALIFCSTLDLDPNSGIEIRKYLQRVIRYCGYTVGQVVVLISCLLYTSPSPRDRTRSRMPSSA